MKLIFAHACSYIILAASAVPDGCTDAKVITDKVLGALPMEDDSYRLGNTKACHLRIT